MLWTVLVPELVVMWAAHQWFDANQIVRARAAGLDATGTRDMAQRHEAGKPYDGNEGEDCSVWTRIHGFFVLMGGCSVLVDGQPVRPHVVQSLIEDTSLNHRSHTPVIAWPVLCAEEIEDKSKGDALAKLLALAQVAWFVIQLGARFVSGLAFSELEVMTLAYASISALLYFFWWDKPLDVHHPILTEERDAPASAPTFIWRSALTVSALFYAHAWIIEEPADPDNVDPFVKIHFTPLATRSDKMSLAMCGFSSSLFGAIHCIAWHVPFPSAAEARIWRASSVLVTAIPLAWFLLSCMTMFIVERLQYYPAYPMRILAAVGLCIYFMARVLLIVEAFVLLRSLPPDAYQVIDWTAYIPHI
ncbi:hypothetical protein PC9H_010803 [Pleurotus ostreatus]|uniref:Uncharacterized protein n=1 Tax=Pleurotus ostreatus TaxID=5322 RepID=A0A8H6ZSC2_PLEOS|nr:uncharacterized protein PC9H_010803 [Pleurotus ostreatus]KAF7422647.1 hypothetical protein PC9H_010803 [Pleurotus ostreatus]KAJ8691465.1 hypothetical protein PTI98_011034 [Pleurotus ostreatus]